MLLAPYAHSFLIISHGGIRNYIHMRNNDILFKGIPEILNVI